jgi:integrase
MDFLADIPDDWISRRKVDRWAPGWAPFRGSLTRASQAYAVHVLHGLYEWLVRAGHLGGNPWTLVNRNAPDAAQPRQAALGPASRAFTPQAWAALHAHLQARPSGPSTARLHWLCTFAEATGLRAAELLAARLGDLQDTGKGWLIVVVGKGGKGRVVPVPQVALQATREYLARRGLTLGDAPSQAPLLSALQAPLTGITYSALYETFTRFVRQALASSALTQAERDAAAGAALHWLRHTHATRAAERGDPLGAMLADQWARLGLAPRAGITVQTHHIAMVMAEQGFGPAIIDSFTVQASAGQALHVRTLLPEVPVEVRALQPLGLRSPQPVADFIAAFRKVTAEG